MIKLKNYIGLKMLACVLLLQMGCQQESIIGDKATGNEPFKIYFLNGTNKGIVNGLSATSVSIDVAQKTANFPVEIFRGGQAGSEPVKVTVAADNGAVTSLIQSGDLPSNTVVLDNASYSFDEDVQLSVEHDMMKGSLLSKVKIEALKQYVGKYVAMGFKLSGTSRYSIDSEMDNVVLYFNVNELAGPISFAASSNTNNGIVNALATSFKVNNSENSVSVPVAIKRSGIADLGSFTVDAVVDNSMIEGMKAAGSLPANTIALSSADYTMDAKVTLARTAEGVGGNAMPAIKIANLNQYRGKKAVLGLKLSNPSAFTIDALRDRAVLYFDVDSLLDETVPPTNLIVNSAWKPLAIAANQNVTFTVNPDGSIKAAGGNSGHAGVFQAVQVSAGRKYKIDMRAKGSGAVDTWYEVYVDTKVPTQGVDYTGSIRLALNTWTGCGKTTFDGLLSSIGCGTNASNTITAAATGTIYVVIKCGGANLGSEGITAYDIDFRRVP